MLSYGQSLSNGWEGWPALSLTPTPGAIMMGDSVRPASENAPLWESVGAPRFRPLAATVQHHITGALLSDDAVAALPDGDCALGETVLEGALAQWLFMRGRDPEFYALASACGVGGRSIEALSKGAQTELFHRLRSCVRTARGVAASWSMEYGIAALLFLQGESNSLGDGAGDRIAYKALLERFHDDFVADVARGAAAMTEPPAMFLYQTGGVYASADNAIAQAQLEVALERPGCFMAAPSYPASDKGGHLDANGYRWLGRQFGKVLHAVLDRGEDWRPLHPGGVARVADSLRLTFHVPVPPLQWGRPFAGQVRQDVADRGFSIFDENGIVPIGGVDLDGPDGVRITLGRDLIGHASVRYAAADRGGIGCLHDSDSTESVARGATGATADEEAHPLKNWSVGFSISVA